MDASGTKKPDMFDCLDLSNKGVLIASDMCPYFRCMCKAGLPSFCIQMDELTCHEHSSSTAAPPTSDPPRTAVYEPAEESSSFNMEAGYVWVPVLLALWLFSAYAYTLYKGYRKRLATRTYQSVR